MRKGINGLSILAQTILADKFCNGAMFVFRGKQADRIKILWWDGQGFCLFYKIVLVTIHCQHKTLSRFVFLYCRNTFAHHFCNPNRFRTTLARPLRLPP